MTAPVIRVEAGDMLDVLPRLIAEGVRVHAVITDPPYHLTTPTRRSHMSNQTMGNSENTPFKRNARGFMGKQWDGGDIAFRPETWRLCYDLLPPGGHLLAFAGTRTYHRIACAIEDAGFEIRDMLAWLYGSGFPKSHNVSKAIDRAAGAEREVVGEWLMPGRGSRSEQQKYGLTNDSGTITAPATDDARAWDGWGTALKPALEPLCIARKPIESTVASNVLAHGTGAFNIDACRIKTGDDLNGGKTNPNYAGAKDGWRRPFQDDADYMVERAQIEADKVRRAEALGRWPANVAHDGSAEVVDAFPDTASGALNEGHKRGVGLHDFAGIGGGTVARDYGNDSGSAARFFYSAKADEGDRLDSKHPTVKPVDLVRWLVRLVTPPGGTVLDPFAGSGTTAMACMAEGFDCVAVEREAEYVADIRRRVAHVHGTDTPLFGG